MKIVILSKENWSHIDNFLQAQIFFNGGDVDENRHFIERKLGARGQFLVGTFFERKRGGDVDEMIDFERVKCFEL